MLQFRRYSKDAHKCDPGGGWKRWHHKDKQGSLGGKTSVDKDKANKKRKVE